MYCTSCGKQTAHGESFCANCGSLCQQTQYHQHPDVHCDTYTNNPRASTGQMTLYTIFLIIEVLFAFVSVGLIVGGIWGGTPLFIIFGIISLVACISLIIYHATVLIRRRKVHGDTMAMDGVNAAMGVAIIGDIHASGATGAASAVAEVAAKAGEACADGAGEAVGGILSAIGDLFS